MLTILVDTDGTCETLDGGQGIVGGVVIERRRVSHIVPVNRFKRAAFHALRIMFGESGRVSDWTRSWRGPWLTRLVGSTRTFVHQSRSACVEWEHEIINREM